MARPFGALVVGVLAVLAGASCTRSTELRFVEKTWPVDHTAVVVVTDELGAPIGGPRVVAPGAPLVFDVADEGAVRIYVETWSPDARASDGRSIVECGVVFGGVGTELPAAATYWRSELVALSSAADIVLLNDVEPTPFDLRFERCIAPDPCAGFRARRVDVPAGIRTRAIAATGADSAIFAGTRPGRERVIGRVEGSSVTLVPDSGAFVDEVGDLAFDGDAAVLGVLEGGAVFRLDLEGQLVDGPRHLGPELERLSSGPDGATFSLDEDGGTWVLARTGTAARAFVGAPTGARGLAAARADRVFVRDSTRVYLFDGETWASELENPIIENISALGADDDVAAVAGELENVRVRDPVSRRWEHVPERPFDQGRRLRAVAGAGGGRFLVGAESGGLALWTGRRWCALGSLVDESLVRLAVSTDRRVAWAVGDGRVAPDGSSILVRAELPPLAQ